MSAQMDRVLARRQQTHGDFRESAVISQLLKKDLRACPGWEKLTASQREALEMIAFKVARILAGDPSHADHWYDVAGYAALVARGLEREDVG